MKPTASPPFTSTPLPRPAQPHPAGFTRVDLAAIAAVCLLGLAATLPTLALTRDRGGQIVCSNNLRLIGQALQIFASEHADQFPWRTPIELGGTSVNRVGNAWWEFSALTNELDTPRVLACPSDRGTPRAADSFSTSPDGGLFHFSYRNNAVSYLIGTDATPASGSFLAAGDRNLRVTGGPVGCSAGINNAALVRNDFVSRIADVNWTNSIHGVQGNLLQADGAVSLVGDDELRVSRLFTEDDNGSVHLLMPK